MRIDNDTFDQLEKLRKQTPRGAQVDESVSHAERNAAQGMKTPEIKAPTVDQQLFGSKCASMQGPPDTGTATTHQLPSAPLQEAPMWQALYPTPVLPNLGALSAVPLAHPQFNALQPVPANIPFMFYPVIPSEPGPRITAVQTKVELTSYYNSNNQVIMTSPMHVTNTTTVNQFR